MIQSPEVRAARALVRDHNRKATAERKAARPKQPAKVKQERTQPTAAGQRQPRIIDKAHKAMIAALPCIATLVRTGHAIYGVHVCHVRSSYPEDGWRGSTGLQRKPDDWRTAPLLPAIHAEQHAGSEVAFWKALGVYPPALCADLRDVSPDPIKGREVIYQHALRARSAAIAARTP